MDNPSERLQQLVFYEAYWIDYFANTYSNKNKFMFIWNKASKCKKKITWYNTTDPLSLLIVRAWPGLNSWHCYHLSCHKRPWQIQLTQFWSAVWCCWDHTWNLYIILWHRQGRSCVHPGSMIAIMKTCTYHFSQRNKIIKHVNTLTSHHFLIVGCCWLTNLSLCVYFGLPRFLSDLTQSSLIKEHFK